MSSPHPEPDLQEIIAESRGRAMRYSRLYTFPYSFVFLVLLGVILAISIITDSVYSNIFSQLIDGLVMTLFVSATSYLSAFFVAVIVGITRSNPPDPPQSRQTTSRAVSSVFMRIAFYNICTVYVSVMRGIPILDRSAGHRIYRGAGHARCRQRCLFG